MVVDSHPTISVLMSIHNGKDHVKAAIESILKQDWTDFEYIIIDDGSTDGTSNILSKAANRDPRIRVITLLENRGLASALNIGLREARGLYVARQDADDISLPNRLGVEVKFLENRPQIHMVASSVENIDGSGQLLEPRRNKPTNWTMIRWGLLFANQFIHTSVLARRESLLAVGGYDESLTTSQDFDLWSRMAQKYELATIPEVLVQYRCHCNQVGIRKRQEQINNSARISARNLAKIGIIPTPAIATSLHRVYGNALNGTPRDVVYAALFLPKVLRAFVRKHGLQKDEQNLLRAYVAREILRAIRNVPRAISERPITGLIATLRFFTVLFRLPSNGFLLKSVGLAVLRHLGFCRLESNSGNQCEAINIT